MSKTNKKSKIISKQRIVRADETNPHERYDDVFRVHTPCRVVSATSIQPGVYLFQTDNKITMQVSVITDSMLRFRYSLDGTFQKDFSYAIDEQFTPEIPETTFVEDTDAFRINTPVISCMVLKDGMKVKIENNEGIIISEDTTGFEAISTILKGITNVSISKKAEKKESFFGLGDKSSKLNLRGQKFENWNTDAFLFDENTDPLYRSIPFFYGLRNGLAYGIFLDNSFRSHFDFCYADKKQFSFSAAGGEMNYYFFYGPELMSVARQYASLTGRPGLPPLWALGFQQSRFSYFPESRVREIADGFRSREIPCDVIYLDIDYMEDYKSFTWNTSHFPIPTEMTRDLRENGFKTIVMIDPGLKVDDNYSIYTEGKERALFCKRANGDLMIGPVWPTDCVFPDFTDPAVRSWWGHLYRTLYSKNKVAGFWNDMNEPAVFMVATKTFPEDVRHDFEGITASHARMHNVYGMQMSRATFEGLLKLKDHRRPYVLTRATFSGGQRYAAVWTGDNFASWEHLKIANIQCQRLSISGFSFVGSDIGGFAGQPSGELFIRWLQLGVFHPLFRAHSIGNNEAGDAEKKTEEDQNNPVESNNREPWSFGDEYTALAKYAIELRYQLLPYLYTCFWQYIKNGAPVLRSLAFYDQEDEKAVSAEDEFIVGDHLLVCPVMKKGRRRVSLYLPEGKWYHYWSANVFEGKQKVKVDAPLAQIPIFIKAGSVIPHYPIRQSVDEKPVDEMTYHIYFKNGKSASQVYEDAGDGFGYVKREYGLKNFEFTGSDNEVQLHQKRSGKWPETYHFCNLLFYGLPFEPKTCLVDGKKTDCETIEISGNTIYVLIIDKVFQEVILS